MPMTDGWFGRYLAAGLLASGVGLLACGGNTLPLEGEAGKAGRGEATAGAPIAGAGGSNAIGGRGGGDGRAEGGSGELGDAGTNANPLSSRAVNLDGHPIYTRVQRLTISQWEHAVTDILRFEASANLSRTFVPPQDRGFFTNNEILLVVDSQAAGEFEAGAEAAAALVTESPDALVRVYADPDPEGFVRTLGRRAFRRPLTSEEETRYQEIFALGETLYGEGFAHGAALVIRAMLQSPKFLYRSELGPGGEPLSGYEVASKLSFWLLGTTPSDDLLDAAAAGELDSVEGLESIARAMLETHAAVEVMRDFHGQLYGWAHYGSIVKPEAAEYSQAWNPEELQQASQAFFDEIFVQGEGLREILTSPRAFVGPALAPLYGIEPAPSGLEMRTLGPSRVGYFTQVPFLLVEGREREPDTVSRGYRMAIDVLCRAVPPPAAELPTIPPLEPGQTNRERLESITGACGSSCHGYFMPLGLALENFDGLGQERDRDNGVPVDTAANYDFAEGMIGFSDGTELMRLMADGMDAATCYAKNLSSYALQRDIAEADRPLLDTLSTVSREESLKALAIALVKNPAFRIRQGATQ